MHVCIVGTSRCGTTLLQELLNLHPSISILNETHWLPKMYEFYGSQKAPWKDLYQIAKKTTWDTGLDLFSVNAKLANFPTSESFTNRFTANLSNYSEITIQEFHSVLVETLFKKNVVWGDKTPDYGFYMGLIQSLWPECKFIHMVRDGLATAKSMSRHSGCMLMVSNGWDNWCSLSYDKLYTKYSVQSVPFTAYISSWCRRLNRIRNESKQLRSGTYLEIDFNTLLYEPVNQLSLISEFLSLSDDVHWHRQCGNIIKFKEREVLNYEQLLQLTSKELALINEFDHTEFFFLPFNAKLSNIKPLLDELRNNQDINTPNHIRKLLSVLSTVACREHTEISMVAEELRKNIIENITNV